MSDRLETGAQLSRSRHPWLFILLVLVFSIPFYFLNLFSLPTPLGLPPSALMILVPFAVALGMRCQEDGTRGIKDLFLPFATRHGAWLLFSVLLVPLLVAAMYGLSLLLGLEDGLGTMLPLDFALLSLVLYFFGAIPEEAGWTMYATRPFVERYGAPRAGFIIGLVWGLWHLVPFMSLGHDWSWIAGQIAVSITLRMIMVQVYIGTQASLLPALAIHASINLYPDMLPGGLSSYHPTILAAFLLITLAAMRGLGTANLETRSPVR